MSGHHSRGVTFFIVDSQRPLELDNVYNQDQVHVVLREGEELEVPDFDDIYASDMVRLSLATCSRMALGQNWGDRIRIFAINNMGFSKLAILSCSYV